MVMNSRHLITPIATTLVAASASISVLTAATVAATIKVLNEHDAGEPLNN